MNYMYDMLKHPGYVDIWLSQFLGCVKKKAQVHTIPIHFHKYCIIISYFVQTACNKLIFNFYSSRAIMSHTDIKFSCLGSGLD